MATKSEKVVDDRTLKMRKAHSSAVSQLKARHYDEYSELLNAAYEAEGLEVRRRLTGEAAAAARAARDEAKREAKRQRLLAQLEALGTDGEPTF